MARGAAQAQRKRAAEARPKRKQSAPSWEEQLFFSRLRRHTKWVYIFLALVFAVGFVAFGVGSGSTGISDILRGNFFGGGGNSLSSRIKDDQKKIAANPGNVSVYLDLATLYQQKQDTGSAAATLERALVVKPKNLDVLNRLASLYRGEAEQTRNVAAAAQAALEANNATPPGVDASSTFGQAFTSDMLSQSLKTKATDAYSKMQTAFTKAEQAYQRLATASKGTSQEANAQLQLASVASDTLQLTGNPSHAQVAVAAYRRYLKLQPNGVNSAAARQSLAQLAPFLPKSHR
jgi:tetratricopeptide (TPR) repeat protein